jgi:hypothetical protein
MSIVQKPSLRLYFSQNHLVATPVFGSVISLDGFESIRKAMPKMLQESKLQKCEAIAQHSGPIRVMWWRDKKDVTLISTYHAAKVQEVLKRGKEKQKPVCVIH